MSKFKLSKDVKVRVWERHYYEVEADTIEEAVASIANGNEYPSDSIELWETCEEMTPEENGGEPTVEICDRVTNEILWNNRFE